MISRLAAFSSRLSSFSLFSTTASSSSLQNMSVKQLVDGIISENKVVIFSKSWCPFCKRVKALFENDYPTERPFVVELDEREDGSAIQSYLAEKTGQSTVPSVFVNEAHVGGNDETQKAAKSGKLLQLLKSNA